MARFHGTARRAFTLIELLTVISIVAVLMALGAAAAHRMQRAYLTSATRTTMQRLNATLEKRLATHNDDTRRTPIPGTVLGFEGEYGDRQRAIFLKLRLKRYFPTSFAEVFNPTPGLGGDETGPVEAYVKYLSDHGITPANVGSLSRPEAQSSACLLMALKLGRDGVSDDELGGAGAMQSVNFGGGIQVPCLVDSWGRPFTFCRWPVGETGTGKSALYPAGYAAGYSDPADPKNSLLPNWPQRATFESTFNHPLPPVATRPPAGQPKPMVLAPVIVSWGADGKPGFNLQTLQQLSADADDNVYGVDAR
jgi:prepilin-type N-terminal cleavage/methylation domain-containing protein